MDCLNYLKRSGAFCMGVFFSLPVYAALGSPNFQRYVQAGLIYKYPIAGGVGFKYVGKTRFYLYCALYDVPISDCR